MNDAPMNEPAEVSPEALEALGYAVYEGPVPFDEVPFPPADDNGDFDWATSDPEICRRYQRLVVAVRNRRVWGAGNDAQAAHDDARKNPDCPAPDQLVYVPIWGRPVPPTGPEERNGGT
jgi:hypothetical protein